MLVSVNRVQDGQAFLFNTDLVRKVTPDPSGALMHVQPPGNQPPSQITVSQDVRDFTDLPGFVRVLERSGDGYNVCGVNLAHVTRMVPGVDGTALHFVGGGGAPAMTVREGIEELMEAAPASMHVLDINGEGGAPARVAFNMAHVANVTRQGQGSALRLVERGGQAHGVRASMDAVLALGDLPQPARGPGLG